VAEIKSSIELAMEKTKNLVMDEEERKLSALRDTENKIRATLRRYLEGMIERDDVEKEMEEIKGDEGLKRSLLLDLLIEEFDIGSDNTRLLELFYIVNGGLQESLKKELATLKNKFKEEMEKRGMIIRERIAGRLREMGITGDGVEPNIEEWDEWKEGHEETGMVFKKRIAEWKNKLTKTLGNKDSSEGTDH
jgi:hypothetical protein